MKRVLVLHPITGIQMLLVMNLRSLGYDVFGFSSTPAFIDAVMNNVQAVDMLIMPHQEQGLSGLELYKNMYEAGINIPVILTTTTPKHLFKDDALYAAINPNANWSNCFLLQPFSRQELISIINNTLMELA